MTVLPSRCEGWADGDIPPPQPPEREELEGGYEEAEQDEEEVVEGKGPIKSALSRLFLSWHALIFGEPLGSRRTGS